MVGASERHRARSIAELREKMKLFGSAPRTESEPYQPRPDDVIVSPYGKCGTTWIQQMFHTLRTGGDLDYDDISRVVPWIETAPQLGIGRQLFVYVVVDPDRDASTAETRVLVNPMVEPVAGELVYDWEGCLSIPDLRGLVPRHPEVRVHARDRDGQPIDYRASGFEARIVQHEYDHLNGVVFLDRMRDLQSLAFGAEWEEFLTEKDHEDAQVG